MGLAQVASILDQEGYHIRIEDLIDKSVFVEQVGLLATERKQQIEKERQDPWGEKGRTKKMEKMKEKKSSKFGAMATRMGFKRK